MANISSDVRNYFKLDLLVARSCDPLRQLFKNRYSQFNGGQAWNDTPTCGNNYLTNIIAKNKKISLTPVQKTSVSSGNSNEWDLTTLTALLLFSDRPQTLNAAEIQQLDEEDKLLKQLREIRNQLAHHASKSVTSAEFTQLWTDFAAILVAFGDIGTELDKLKDDSVFESPNQPINEDNVKEILRLNSLGTQAHKNGNFSEAITLFTKAAVLPGVENHDRAICFSDMASSRLALYEQQAGSTGRFEIDDPTDQRYRALQDAKQARNLWSTWWKGHLRVGKVYAVLNEHEKAINSFGRALALAPTESDIQKALDESREIHSRQLRQDHLDPGWRPRSIPEQLNEMHQKFGMDPEQVRDTYSSLAEIDPSIADVVKGYKYEHGDVDVKQDYEQAASYFAKAASQGNAEGMANLARLTDRGLGVKKDHNMAQKLLEQAAAQPPQHPKLKSARNIGVAEAEHSLALRYAEGIVVHKNLATAAYWYQRAMDHGNTQSANNLGLMYQNGTGVDMDLDKAKQLFEVSAGEGDSHAMLNLALLLFHKNDFQMAKIWYDRACEEGNIVAQADRDKFERGLQERQQFVNGSSSNTLQVMNKLINVRDSLKTSTTASSLSGRSYINDYYMLLEHANRGSITARKMCDALEHFTQALSILIETNTLTENEENMFVHELSQCYRLEHIVAQIPGIEMRQKIEKLVDHVLHRCSTESNTAVSQLDEDTRICYASLHLDSPKEMVPFLSSCKQKYPKSVYFFELSAAINGWLEQYEATLYDANLGLEIDPNYHQLLYDKAGALRLIGNDMDEAVEAYGAFLAAAPKDHRKVPDSYYTMASCFFFAHKTHPDITEIVKKMYEQGEEAENIQLPCFLPYESNSKTLLKQVLDATSLVNVKPPAAAINDKSHLTNSHRIEVILEHRKWQRTLLQARDNPVDAVMHTTDQPRVQQRTAKSLIGLKPITLREMNPTMDHVYDGYVLSATIIEEAYSWTPSIHLVIEDEHLDCEKMCIYGFPEDQGEHLTSKVFTIGSKMHIINPYLQLNATDGKPVIRIDEFPSIMMQSESERVMNMCRYCGEANAAHKCSQCKRAHYCTKECQTMDWQLYKHKLICKNQ
jgi:TPR repeat protein/uncharacterized coiled-coil DUF342 family protein